MSTPFFDEVLYSGQNEPNHDGLRFSEPVGCLNGDMTAHEYKTLWYAAVADIEKLQTRMVETTDMLRRQHAEITALRNALEPVQQCDHCTKFFSQYRCNASHGECDCPKCQGFCTCSQQPEVNK